VQNPRPVTPKIRHVILCKDYTLARPVSRRVVNYDEKEIGCMSSEQKDFPCANPDMRNAGNHVEQNQTPAGEGGFIDEKQLLAKLPISRGTLSNWKAKGLLPYIKIGRRCLYDWASVQGALLRRQRGGSGSLVPP
jgi:hypothetical protein